MSRSLSTQLLLLSPPFKQRQPHRKAACFDRGLKRRNLFTFFPLQYLPSDKLIGTMAEVRRWQSASGVRKLLESLPNTSPNWGHDNYWREFGVCHLSNKWHDYTDISQTGRRKCLQSLTTSTKPSETEREVLKASFKYWVRHSQEWWTGDWVEYPGMADWHVNQYLRCGKQRDQGLRSWFVGCSCANFVLERSIEAAYFAQTQAGDVQEEQATNVDPSLLPRQTTSVYYDPARDV